MPSLHDVPVIVQTLDRHPGARDRAGREPAAAGPVGAGRGRRLSAPDRTSSAIPHAELGELVGKSRSHVANMLRLLALPDAVKAMLQSGELSAGHARALLTAPDPEALAKA